MSASHKRTPLYDTHLKHNARMVPFGGWEMPLSYEGQIAEHLAVRRHIGIFDVSHMGQVRFTGPQVLEFLQWLVPGNMAALSHGESKYTQLVNEQGGVLDDLIISFVAEHEYFAVVNAATREGDVAWMRAKAKDSGLSVVIEDESERWAMIAVQGPEALALLARMIPGIQVEGTKAFTLMPFTHGGEPHLLSRTGYTGELGAEVLCPPKLATEWWERLMKAGAKPCGLAARDSLRLEAGYCLYGQDISKNETPIEAGLGWSVSIKKPENYIGRSVLEKQKKEGPLRQLIGLRAERRRPIRAHDKVVLGDTEIGEVTSGGYSPQLECGIALAYVPSEHAKAEGLAVRSRGKDIPVKVTNPPFVKTSLSKN